MAYIVRHAIFNNNIELRTNREVNSVFVCPDSCVENGWCIAEKHRSHEGHAEPGQNPRDPGYHEGTL